MRRWTAAWRVDPGPGARPDPRLRAHDVQVELLRVELEGSIAGIYDNVSRAEAHLLAREPSVHRLRCRGGIFVVIFS